MNLLAHVHQSFIRHIVMTFSKSFFSIFPVIHCSRLKDLLLSLRPTLRATTITPVSTTNDNLKWDYFISFLAGLRSACRKLCTISTLMQVRGSPVTASSPAIYTYCICMETANSIYWNKMALWARKKLHWMQLRSTLDIWSLKIITWCVWGTCLYQYHSFTWNALTYLSSEINVHRKAK